MDRTRNSRNGESGIAHTLYGVNEQPLLRSANCTVQDSKTTSPSLLHSVIFKGRVTHGERETEIFHLLIHLFHCLQHPPLNQVEARNLKATCTSTRMTQA